MPTRIILIMFALACIAPAQDDATPAEQKPAKTTKTTEPTKKAEQKQPAADAGENKGRVVKVTKKDEVRVLKPKDVASELLRLKSKADIKAEITVRTTTGRPVVFKGVIRNGKLIERIFKRRFVPQKDLKNPRCGVRIWWSGGTDGYIFFRYSIIKSLAITGRLTDAERREIMRRLKANKGDRQAAAKGEEKVDPEIAKMKPAELKAYLLKKYPYDAGWNHKKMRALKRHKLIDNKLLSADEEVFIKYFAILVEAHFEDLKRSTRKIEIEPGADQPESSDKPDDEPSEDGEADEGAGADGN